jgi:hypothetical protein
MWQYGKHKRKKGLYQNNLLLIVTKKKWEKCGDVLVFFSCLIDKWVYQQSTFTIHCFDVWSNHQYIEQYNIKNIRRSFFFVFIIYTYLYKWLMRIVKCYIKLYTINKYDMRATISSLSFFFFYVQHRKRIVSCFACSLPFFIREREREQKKQISLIFIFFVQNTIHTNT